MIDKPGHFQLWCFNTDLHFVLCELGPISFAFAFSLYDVELNSWSRQEKERKIHMTASHLLGPQLEQVMLRCYRDVGESSWQLLLGSGL